LLNLKKTKIKITSIEQEIIEQTKEALKKADLIIMVVDGQAGLLPEDKELALVLKKLKTPTVLVCNKIDNQKYQYQINDFFKLGLGNPYPVSAVNGSQVGDFLDELIKKMKWPVGRPAKQVEKSGIKVAMIGKPNAGKSSLVNQILGEKRVIVSDTPQTTREPQDTEIIYKGQKIILIDTAGLRKKANIKPGLEKQATKKTITTIKKADIILLVTESDKALAKQDSHLAGLIKDSGAGIIVIANKWDLIEDKDEKIDSKMMHYYQQQFPFLSFAPLIFISAKTGKNVDKILDLILQINEELNKKIPEEKLLEVLKTAVKKHRPVKAKGEKRPHIYAIKQTRIAPPEFLVIIGQDESLHFSYLRFIENQIREHFGFSGVPVIIKVRNIKR